MATTEYALVKHHQNTLTLATAEIPNRVLALASDTFQLVIKNEAGTSTLVIPSSLSNYSTTGTITGASVTASGAVTGATIVKSGGTSAQILMGNGGVISYALATNQVAFGTGSGFTGSARLTFSGTTLTIPGDAGSPIPKLALIQHAGTAGGPELLMTCAGGGSDYSGKIVWNYARILGVQDQAAPLQMSCYNNGSSLWESIAAFAPGNKAASGLNLLIGAYRVAGVSAIDSSRNGSFAALTATGTTTLATSLTGILKAASGVVSAASAGVDYQAALTNPVTGTGAGVSGQIAVFSGANAVGGATTLTVSAGVLTASGFVKSGGTAAQLLAADGTTKGTSLIYAEGYSGSFFYTLGAPFNTQSSAPVLTGSRTILLSSLAVGETLIVRFEGEIAATVDSRMMVYINNTTQMATKIGPPSTGGRCIYEARLTIGERSGGDTTIITTYTLNMFSTGAGYPSTTSWGYTLGTETYADSTSMVIGVGLNSDGLNYQQSFRIYKESI